MSAMDLAVAAVENGKSIRKAAKEFASSPSTLYSHLVLLKRPVSADVKEKESLIASAMESINPFETVDDARCCEDLWNSLSNASRENQKSQ